jgi:hypothetical protein
VLAYTVKILSRLVEVCPKVYFLIVHATVNSLKIYVLVGLREDL